MPKIHFPTYKGINLSLLPRNTGATGYPTQTAGEGWLESWYDATVAGDVLDHILTYGIKTIRVWIFLDSFINKAVADDGGKTFGQAGWDPTDDDVWDMATQIANFENLCSLLQARGMKMIVSLLHPSSDAGARHQFDEDCLIPVSDLVTSPLMDATLAKGNLAALSTGAAEWVYSTGANSVTLQADTAGTTQVTAFGAGYSANEFLLDGSSGARAIRSPLVTFTPGNLIYGSVALRGVINSVTVNLYKSNNVYNSEFFQPQASSVDYGTTWTELKFPFKMDNLDSLSVKFGLVISVANGATGYAGSCRVNNSSGVSPTYQNYLDALTNFCVTRYGAGTQYGSAICGWSTMKEQYANISQWKLYPFLKAAYTAMSAADGPPIIIDSNNTAAYSPITTAGNTGWYTDACDIVSLHVYDDEGDLPDISIVTLPWIIGEYAATGNPPVAATNAIAIQNILDASYARGALCALFWQWLTSGADPQLPNKTTPFSKTVPGQVLSDYSTVKRFNNLIRMLKRDI